MVVWCLKLNHTNPTAFTRNTFHRWLQVAKFANIANNVHVKTQCNNTTKLYNTNCAHSCKVIQKIVITFVKNNLTFIEHCSFSKAVCKGGVTGKSFKTKIIFGVYLSNKTVNTRWLAYVLITFSLMQCFVCKNNGTNWERCSINAGKCMVKKELQHIHCSEIEKCKINKLNAFL